MPNINFDVKPFFLRPELLQHPQIPSPMAEVAPRNIMGQEWWNAQRKAAYDANNRCCWACGSHDALEAHEAYEINYFKYEMVFVEVVALCSDCHMFIHAGFAKRKLSKAEFKKVILHGHRVLKKAKLQANWSLRSVLSVFDVWAIPVIDNIGPDPIHYGRRWDNWRMVFENVRYPPKFKNPEEADDYYNSKRKGDTL